jgi:hypothetical protein
MWHPDFLHRTKRMTIFPPEAGQSPDHSRILQQNKVVAPPPRGQPFDLIVHLDRVEDWSPPLERTPSSAQSGVPSSDSSNSVEYPKVYDSEDWVPGVVDNRRALPRAHSCRPPPAAHAQRHQDKDDDDDGEPRRQPRDFLDRGRHAFNLICRTAGGTSGGGRSGGRHERTRSPDHYRHRGNAHGHGAPKDGARGRSVGRGGCAYWRARDPARRDEGVDWERRRSRSPTAQTLRHQAAAMSVAMGGDDDGWRPGRGAADCHLAG